MTIAQTVSAIRNKLTRATSSVTSEISQLREQIKTKRQELKFTRQSPLPAEDLRKRIAEQVQTAGTRWLEGHVGSLGGAEHAITAWQPRLRRIRLPELNSWDALCASAPQEAQARLERLCASALERFPAGPRAADRPALIERLEAELAELEVAEETVIDEAAAAGVHVEHRVEVRQRRARRAEADEQARHAVENREGRQRALDEAHARRTKTVALGPNGEPLGPRGSRSGYISRGGMPRAAE